MNERLDIQFTERLADVPATDWNRLATGAPPFMRHEFLQALEASKSVAGEAGWQPLHAIARDGDGQLLAAMPLYAKTHSWGEFVFDWAWADAYQRAGLAYYPKLVSASPFTPATAPRLLLAADCAQPAALADAMLGATEHLASGNGLSSLHLQFTDQASLEFAKTRGYLVRKDCQFHWRNQHYADFDAFLTTFSSAKRKKVKRERRRLAEAGITFEHRTGADLGEADINDAYTLTRNTFRVRGREHYLNVEFFHLLASALPSVLHVVFARTAERRIAAAVFYRSDDTLYGRYWGCDEEYHSLHFETCYYQGIELAITEKLSIFEPGTQGEHKISRGFLPVETHSAHWLREPAFADAIGDYLGREAEHIDDYIAAVNDHSPYRADRRHD